MAWPYKVIAWSYSTSASPIRMWEDPHISFIVHHSALDISLRCSLFVSSPRQGRMLRNWALVIKFWCLKNCFSAPLCFCLLLQGFALELRTPLQPARSGWMNEWLHQVWSTLPLGVSSRHLYISKPIMSGSLYLCVCFPRSSVNCSLHADLGGERWRGSSGAGLMVLQAAGAQSEGLITDAL